MDLGLLDQVVFFLLVIGHPPSFRRSQLTVSLGRLASFHDMIAGYYQEEDSDHHARHRCEAENAKEMAEKIKPTALGA